jgi:uncharacterized protein YutE (UPF0331/DUF86 family)
MAYESPIFQSSIDLFAHSIEHFNSGTERDRKFVILHLANSVELLLKDLLLDLGETIYKNPKETISIAGAISTLTKKNINIPFLNKLELLIDERNALQHRYGFPNELTTIFYMDTTYKFFESFLKDNYSLNIKDVLTEYLTEPQLASFQIGQTSSQKELEKLIRFAKLHPVGSLLSGYAYYEKLLSYIKENIGFGAKTSKGRVVSFFTTLHLIKLFEDFNLPLSKRLAKLIETMTKARNQAAHGREEPTSEEVIKYLKAIKELEPLIEELNKKIEIKKDEKQLLPAP